VYLGLFLACATIHHASATSATVLNKRRERALESEHSSDKKDQSNSSGLRVQRLAPTSAELHVVSRTTSKTSMEVGSFDTTRASGDHVFVQIDSKNHMQRRHGNHNLTRPVGSILKHRSNETSESFSAEPMFLQMGSTTDVEHEGQQDNHTTNEQPVSTITANLVASSPTVSSSKLASLAESESAIGVAVPENAGSTGDVEYFESKVTNLPAAASEHEGQHSSQSQRGKQSGPVLSPSIVNAVALAEASVGSLEDKIEQSSAVGLAAASVEKIQDKIEQSLSSNTVSSATDRAKAAAAQPAPTSENVAGLEQSGSSSAVKDLSDRTASSPSSFMQGNSAESVSQDASDHTFIGWVKDFFAVGGRGAEIKGSNAADSLGAPEAEANGGMDTEGLWLLLSMAGLIFFSCAFVCLMKFPFGNCAATRRPFSTESESSQSKTDAESDADQKVVLKLPKLVPNATDVINSARAKEEDVMVRTFGGAKEISSGMLCAPATPRASNSKTKGSNSNTVCAQPVVCTGLREHVLSVPSSTEDALAKLDAASAQAGGYDCAVARPLSFSQLLRFQATIVQSPHGDFMAPLALKFCVVYQVTVSRRMHAGMLPVPVAFSSMSTSFQVAPCDHPDLRIAVDGAAVMLFDTVAGHFGFKGSFASAPGHLQDYVLTHRSAVPGGHWQTSSTLERDATPLEFQECALLVGSQVTLVGELARDAGGELVLKPACLALPELSDSPRVLVSVDPRFH